MKFLQVLIYWTSLVLCVRLLQMWGMYVISRTSITMYLLQLLFRSRWCDDSADETTVLKESTPHCNRTYQFVICSRSTVSGNLNICSNYADSSRFMCLRIYVIWDTFVAINIEKATCHDELVSPSSSSTLLAWGESPNVEANSSIALGDRRSDGA